MDNEIVESVLRDILEEQRAGIQATKEINSRIQELAVQVEGLSQKLDQQKHIRPPGDTRLVQALVENGINRMEELVSQQPKSVVRQYQFLLFPEMYADNYYRIVFGRLLFWMMIFVVATYLFMLGKQGIESWAQIEQKEVETNQYKKAWHYLYQHDKKLKVKMDSAWVKSWGL